MSISSNGTATFTTSGPIVGAVVGFRAGPNDYNFGAAQHGFFLRGSVFNVVESGVAVSTTFSFAPGGVFSIARSGTTVSYLYDGLSVHNSVKPIGGSTYLSATLFSGGDTIADAALSGSATVYTSGQDNARLRALVSRGGRGAKRSGGKSSLQALRNRSGVMPPTPAVASSSNYLPPLLSSSRGNGSGTSVRPGNSLVDSAAQWAPGQWEGFTLAIVAGAGAGQSEVIGANLSGALLINNDWATPLDASTRYEIRLGASVLYRGSFTPVLQKLRSLISIGSEGEYATSHNTLPALSSRGGKARAVDGFAMLKMRGPYKVVAQATLQPRSGVVAKMGKPIVAIQLGASVKARMRVPTTTITGTGVVVARLRAVMPPPRVLANAVTGSVGIVVAALPGRFKVQAFLGSVIETTLHDGYTVKVAGLTGSVGRIVARMPLFVVEAASVTVNVGRIEALMPTLRPVVSGILRALMPMGRLTAIGTAVVALEYEGYAVNLISNGNPKDPTGNEVTHYTGFPFDQIVRHGNRYYGVSSMGLFLLGGDTDEGAVIPWAARTATTDFGTKQEKAVVSVYLGGQMTPTVTATVFTGEDGVPNYTYPVPPSAKGENRRAKFGRGLKARYISLELADAQGGALALDALDIEINQLKRAL